MKFLYHFKLIFFNKKLFFRTEEENYKNVLLVELFSIKSTIISFFLFTNAFSDLFKTKIIAYDTRFLTPKKKILILILNFFNFFNYYGLYRSLGVKNFIYPSKNKKLESEGKKLSAVILNKLKKKSDITKIKIHNILVGDLFYDTFLREKNKVTIDINSNEFNLFLKESVQLFLYWFYLLTDKKIKGIIVSHSVYVTALPARIAAYKNIKAYCVNYHSVFQITKKELLVWGGFRKYPKEFIKISKNKKNDCIAAARRNLKKRFSGNNDNLYNISATLKSKTYIKDTNFAERILANNSNTKILVAAHDFTDAVNGHGRLIFPDMYEWINFLIQFSKEKNYEWYLKLHPSEYDSNLDKIKSVVVGAKNFFILPKEVSHNQLIKEGIKCVLTVFGSIGHEYPYFGIPVINAGENPHSGYNFNYHPKTRSEYVYILNRITKLSVPKNAKRNIFEFYYMKHMCDYNIFPDITTMQDLNSFIIFKYFFDNLSSGNYIKIIRDYKGFILSNDRRMIKQKKYKIS